jgi:hypothetical protein
MSRVPRPPPPSPPQEEEECDEDEMCDEDEEMEFGDPMEVLGALLSTEEGETIATALVGLKDATEKIAMSLEMQNKILVKILSAISKSSPEPKYVAAPA